MTLDADLVADALPGYEILGELGRGGWGVVLAGRHRTLDRLVAIKQLPRAFAADPQVRSRFVAEARVLASLSHPHLVPVYDFVERDGLCLLVMEHLTGGTLWDRFQARGITAEAACSVAVATLAGLHHAHEHGVLHRDVKPENLLFSASAVLKVTDFGIAKVLGGARTLATRAGEVLGTPAYMAPEQVRGDEVGPAADIYAVGVVLYELLSGSLPFAEDGDAVAVAYRHVHEEPTPLTTRAPAVPAPLAEAVMRALARQPDDRFSSAEDFAVSVAEAATGGYGQGWSDRAAMPLHAGARVQAATTTPSPRAAPATVVEAADQAVPATPTVRPSTVIHVAGALPGDVSPGDLVSAGEVVLASARPLAAASAALVALAAAVAVLAPGAPAEPPPTAGLSLGGTPVTDAAVRLDLSDPVPVVLPAAAPSGTVTLRLSTLGVPLAEGHAPTAGGAPVEIDLSDARYLVAGPVRAEVSVGTARYEAVAEPAGGGLVSIPGAGAVLLGLLAVAWGEALLRPRRRGRRTPGAPAALGAVGALLGVALAVAGWTLASAELSWFTVGLCAALSCAAGLFAGEAAARAGHGSGS